MLHESGILSAPLFCGLSPTRFSSLVSAMAEEEGTPWWIWILIIVVFLAFAAFVIWWWLRTKGEEEALRVSSRPAAAGPDQTLHAPVIQVETPATALSAAPQPDDLKLIEGIGPKISGVLQAAGITTFAQLAGTEVERLKQILAEADPNLLRLADPTTWPEQAKLAAQGEWEALQKLQGGLKGGRRA